MDRNFSFFSETQEELENIFESGRKYRRELFDQTFQSDLKSFQENLQEVITKEVEKNVKRNYSENFPIVTNNAKNKITNQRRGKYNFHKNPSKDFPSNKKVLFNSFFNNEIVIEKKPHSFKPKNENNFSNFLQKSLINNFPCKFNDFEDIERLSNSIDEINNKVLALNEKELKNSKLLYSSVLKFPENENSEKCKDENSTIKVKENKILSKRISSKKTLIEKIEISSMSNMEKLLKKIEENQIKMPEISKIDFKNLPRMISGENLIQKNEEDKLMLQLGDLEIHSCDEENSDGSEIEDFDVLEKETLELITRF